MLFENVKAILDKAKEKDVDVLVARDMLISENPDKNESLREASEFLDKFYKPITKCRRLGDNEAIKKLCEFHSAREDEALKKAVEEITNRAED